MSSAKTTDWDAETDLVVGGTGIGAATAAITADEAGLDVILLEKSPVIGGVSAISGGEVWVGNNHLTTREDTDEAVEAYLGYNAPNEPDPDLLETWIRTAPDALAFLEEAADVQCMVIDDYPDYLYPYAPGTTPEGRYLEVAPIKRDELGHRADYLLVSPVFPVDVTHNELFAWGGFAGFDAWDRDLLDERREAGYLTWGTGVMAYLLRQSSTGTSPSTWRRQSRTS